MTGTAKDHGYWDQKCNDLPPDKATSGMVQGNRNTAQMATREKSATRAKERYMQKGSSSDQYGRSGGRVISRHMGQ